MEIKTLDSIVELLLQQAELREKALRERYAAERHRLKVDNSQAPDPAEIRALRTAAYDLLFASQK